MLPTTKNLLRFFFVGFLVSENTFYLWVRPFEVITTTLCHSLLRAATAKFLGYFLNHFMKSLVSFFCFVFFFIKKKLEIYYASLERTFFFLS